MEPSVFETCYTNEVNFGCLSVVYLKAKGFLRAVKYISVQFLPDPGVVTRCNSIRYRVYTPLCCSLVNSLLFHVNVRIIRNQFFVYRLRM